MYAVVILGGIAMLAVVACVYGVLCHKADEPTQPDTDGSNSPLIS